jgi:adenylate cyclase
MSTAPTKSKKIVSRRQSKQRYHILIIAGVGLLFAISVTLIQPFSTVRLWLSDQLFTTESPSPNIVVVGIDDNTLQSYGKWSNWSRLLHAQAIDNLEKAGAKVVGFDILFVDSSPDDPVFAKAIENAGNVVLPVVGTQALPANGDKVTYDYFLTPVSPLDEAYKAIGHANIVPDRDGKVRRIPLVVQDKAGQTYPSFSLAILNTLFSMTLPEKFQRENGAINLLARDIPVDNVYQLRINFSPESESRPYLSYGDIISGNFDPAMVKNKIVVIGMTATGEFDTWAVPTSASKVPGVYIHAAAMDTILRNQFLTDVRPLTTLLIMLLLTAIVSLTLPVLRLKWGGVVIMVLFVGYLVTSFMVFDRGHILNLLYPPLLLPVTYITSIATMVVIEQSDKRFVKSLFGRYVSPQVAEQILTLADAGTLQLGGEQREATILFADIRGFTKMSEQLSPEAIVHMLNSYLSVMIDRVLENGGMVNKFAGDNIMAVWNAPQIQKEHARLAVKAAWEAQQAMGEVRKKDPSLPVALFGIGINTGQAVAGNVGSSGRSEYTVIGDAVNLASRICSGTTGGEVWLGPETYRQAKEYVEVVALEPQEFKGKSERVVVYRLTGLK